MKTLLVNILNEGKAGDVLQILSEIKDVRVEELDNSTYPDLSDEQVSVLNDRIEAYERDPGKTISLDDFKNFRNFR